MQAAPVSDLGSNAPENILHAATAIGRSKDRLKVFDAVYKGKKRIKTVSEISSSTGLKRKRVLEEGVKLASNHIVTQKKVDGETAYEKINFFHQNKAKVIALSKSKAKREAFPTKRNPAGTSGKNIKVELTVKQRKVKRITLDDIDSFKKSWKVASAAELAKTISENKFRNGIKRILGELGKFKDWGGETNDLYSSRVTMGGKRKVTAFAFKGPGKRGKLTPGKMGKNGDQIQRLFDSPAVVMIVQYHGQIDQSVMSQMEKLAIAKSFLTGEVIHFGIIDGIDSNRIYKAYANKF